MAQKDYDELMKLTPSRYQLTMVVSRRAGQLKYGVANTLTSKPIPREKNAVSAAMEELVEGSGVKWGNDLPDQATVIQTVQNESRERRDRPEGTFTVTREDDDDDLPKIPLKGAYRDRS